MQLEINKELRQDGDYELMRYKPVENLTGILRFRSLQDGAIIMTGTAKGIGQLHNGGRIVGRLKSGQQVRVSQEWPA